MIKPIVLLIDIGAVTTFLAVVLRRDGYDEFFRGGARFARKRRIDFSPE
jgi:hypothetical protein